MILLVRGRVPKSQGRHRSHRQFNPRKFVRIPVIEEYLPIDELLRAFRVSCALYFNAWCDVFNLAKVICC